MKPPQGRRCANGIARGNSREHPDLRRSITTASVIAIRLHRVDCTPRHGIELPIVSCLGRSALFPRHRHSGCFNQRTCICYRGASPTWLVTRVPRVDCRLTPGLGTALHYYAATGNAGVCRRLPLRSPSHRLESIRYGIRHGRAPKGGHRLGGTLSAGGTRRERRLRLVGQGRLAEPPAAASPGLRFYRSHHQLRRSRCRAERAALSRPLPRHVLDACARAGSAHRRRLLHLLSAVPHQSLRLLRNLLRHSDGVEKHLRHALPRDFSWLLSVLPGEIQALEGLRNSATHSAAARREEVGWVRERALGTASTTGTSQRLGKGAEKNKQQAPILVLDERLLARGR